MTNNLMARLRHWQQYGPYRPSRYKEAADRIEKLEAALRNVTTAWDIWQKAKDSNSFTELFASICEAKALEDTQ